MSIRVIGANPRRFPAEVVLQAAINRRISDVAGEDYVPLGIPLEIIYLDWNPTKKCYHQTKTKGDFHNTFITRLQGGGLLVQYKSPGSLEWLKDGLTGVFSAMAARTPKNLRLLASMFYDGLWTVRDKTVRAEIKMMADEIDEENKKIPFTYKKVVKKFDDASGNYINEEIEVEASMYDFHKERREAHLKSKYAAETIAPLGVFNEQMGMQQEREAIDRQRKELDDRTDRITEKEKMLKIVVDVIPNAPPSAAEGPPVPEYTGEELDNMKKENFGTFRKFARDKFGIDSFKMKYDEIKELILKKQSEPEPEKEESITS